MTNQSTSDYVDMLMDSFSGGDGKPQSLASTTLELLNLHLRYAYSSPDARVSHTGVSSILKIAAKGEDAVLQQVTNSFVGSSAFHAPVDQGHRSGPLRTQALIYLVDVLCAEYKAAE